MQISRFRQSSRPGGDGCRPRKETEMANLSDASLPQFFSQPLTIEPRAVRVYTDLKRGKPIVVITYRRRDMSEADAIGWAGMIQADLARAGYAIRPDAPAPRITP